MKFVVLVEGHTERAVLGDFLRRWFDEVKQFRPLIAVKIENFDGSGDLWKTGPKKAQMHLDNPKSADIIAVIGLLDLYGANFIQGDFSSAKQRVDWATEEMKKKVNRPDRFRMFFAVHELEAWILSQPEILPFDVREKDKKKMDAPENINFHEPPAKLLDRLFRANQKGRYKKSIDGTKLFRKLDPAVAYDRCPHLKHMLDEMLRLVRASQKLP